MLSLDRLEQQTAFVEYWKSLKYSSVFEPCLRQVWSSGDQPTTDLASRNRLSAIGDDAIALCLKNFATDLRFTKDTEFTSESWVTDFQTQAKVLSDWIGQTHSFSVLSSKLLPDHKFAERAKLAALSCRELPVAFNHPARILRRLLVESAVYCELIDEPSLRRGLNNVAKAILAINFEDPATAIYTTSLFNRWQEQVVKQPDPVLRCPPWL